MAVTDLMVAIGSETDTDAKLVHKADKVLKGKGKAEDIGLKKDEPVSFEELCSEPEDEPITIAELKEVYPIKVSDVVLQNAVDIINNASKNLDFTMAQYFRESCINHIDIMKESKHRVSFQDYVNACKFVTFKMAGNTDVRAYALTFPDRVRRMERERISNSHLYQYANIYSKNKTVVEVMTKVMVPKYVMYQDWFDKAVNVQGEIMLNDKVSPKVRSDAANSLMTHLKPPEIKQAELKINTSGSEAISQLAEALNNLSGKQRELILTGEYTIKDVSEAEIYTENTDE